MGGPCKLKTAEGTKIGPAATDNFQIKAFEYEGQTFYSCEHAYQAGKCPAGSEGRMTIQEIAPYKDEDPSNHGMRCWDVGQSVAGVRADWDSAKLNVMLEVNRAKYATHAVCRDELLATGDVEICGGPSTGWTFKGFPESWTFWNGKIQMLIREELRPTPSAEQAQRRLELQALFDEYNREDRKSPVVKPSSAPEPVPDDPRFKCKLVALQTQLDELKGQVHASGAGPAVAAGDTVFEREVEGLAFQGPKAPQITLLNSLSTLVWGALDSSLFLPGALVYACDHTRGAFHVVFYIWTMNVALFSAQYFGYHNAIERWSLVSTGNYEPILWLLSAATLFIFCTVKAISAYQELTDTLCEHSGKKRERGQDKYSTDSLLVWLILLVQKIVLENYPSIIILASEAPGYSLSNITACVLFFTIAAFPWTYPKDYGLGRFTSAAFYGFLWYIFICTGILVLQDYFSSWKGYFLSRLKGFDDESDGIRLHFSTLQFVRTIYFSLPADFLACFLYGWYGFDNHWISSGKTLQERVRELEIHWLYYVGFGLPWVVLSKFVPYFTFYACFLAAFPLLVVRGSQLQHQDSFLTKQYPRGFKYNYFDILWGVTDSCPAQLEDGLPVFSFSNGVNSWLAPLINPKKEKKD